MSPNYDYFCRSCERDWEAFQTIADMHKERCAVCGKFATVTINCHVGGHGFRARVLNDVGEHPVKIHSAKDADRAAKANGVTIDKLR